MRIIDWSSDVCSSDLVRNQVLLLNRYPLAFFSHFLNRNRFAFLINGCDELDHPSSCLIALGDQWAPAQNLLDVLQADDIGANLASPTDTHPCQCANLPITGLTTFGLGMVRAVRRKVQPPHRPATGGLFLSYLEHVSFVVLRLRMVDLMHANGIRVVVDRNVNMLASCHFIGRRPTAATGKQVNDDLLSKRQNELARLHGIP